jgi:DNA-binding response OmpR family regulator
MALLHRKHILLISYNEQLLIQRRILLEEAGYQVSSALGLKEALANCKDEAYDLLILGHSIPHADKVGLVRSFRVHCAAPILSLWERGQIIADSVDYLTFSDVPEKLLGNVAAILARESQPRRPGEQSRRL